MNNLIYLFAFLLFINCHDSDDGVVDESLSESDIKNLQFLKEEEKLARDVYLYAYDLYEQGIFMNISSSEQSHMNSVTSILDKYNIEDLSSDSRGVFKNTELQDLYNELISLADKSLQEALFVGATIEDLDIKDLISFMSNTDQSDLENLYGTLSCGSGNHMRAFVQNIEAYGSVYEPQFITDELYTLILDGEREKCIN